MGRCYRLIITASCERPIWGKGVATAVKIAITAITITSSTIVKPFFVFFFIFFTPFTDKIHTPLSILYSLYKIDKAYIQYIKLRYFVRIV